MTLGLKSGRSPSRRKLKKRCSKVQVVCKS
jgi:hypothetical protein